MIERKGLCFALVALIFLIIFSVGKVAPVEVCYGPHITADIDRNEVYINDIVTIIRQICPAEARAKKGIFFGVNAP